VLEEEGLVEEAFDDEGAEGTEELVDAGTGGEEEA
jgi:hypothetical protein